MTQKTSGFRHPKCFGNGDGKCCTKISSEHFISQGILKRLELAGKVKVAGLAWQDSESFDLIGINSLVANVLCSDHNTALSDLDAAALQTIEAISRFDNREITTETVAVSGINLELWMLKCLVGITVSKNLRSTLKPDCIDILFQRKPWPSRWGLYFGTQNEPIYHTQSFMLKTRVDESRNLILAADFLLNGFPFVLLLGRPEKQQGFGIRRPGTIVLRDKPRALTLKLGWGLNRTKGEFVVLDRSGTYDGHPPNWKEWERVG